MSSILSIGQKINFAKGAGHRSHDRPITFSYDRSQHSTEDELNYHEISGMGWALIANLLEGQPRFSPMAPKRIGVAPMNF